MNRQLFAERKGHVDKPAFKFEGLSCSHCDLCFHVASLALNGSCIASHCLRLKG